MLTLDAVVCMSWRVCFLPFLHRHCTSAANLVNKEAVADRKAYQSYEVQWLVGVRALTPSLGAAALK